MVSRTVRFRCALILALLLFLSSCFDNPSVLDPDQAPQSYYIDNQAPTALLSVPSSGVTASGVITIIAYAEDNIGIDHVEFYLDETILPGGSIDAAPYEIEWNTSACADSSYHSIYVKAFDTSLNFAYSDTAVVMVDNSSPPPPDTEPPSIQLTAPQDGATVSGRYVLLAQASDNIGIAHVEFYIDGVMPPGSREYHVPYEHAWNTTVLSDGGSHSIAAKATDESGNVAYSDTIHVTVDNAAPPPPDAEPPTVSIASPADGAEVSGTIMISAAASDNAAVKQVEFYLDGSLLPNGVDYAAPYTCELNTSAYANGSSHLVTARAVDTSDNSAVCDAVQISVNNYSPPPPDTEPPTVSIAAPGDGDIVSGIVTITAEAVDDNGVRQVEFLIDGRFPEGNVEYHAPYEHAWNTTVLSDGGSHSIAAKATDESGNVAYSDTIHVTVDNAAPPPPDAEPPTVSIASPADGAEVSGTIMISAAASDNAAVKQVEFYLDGSLLPNGVDYAAPYTCELNTSAYANGSSHVIIARAVDTSNNEALSSMITITVQNQSADTEPPSANVVSPANGAIVSGSVHILVAAGDNVAVDHVQMYIDGISPAGATEYNPPYEYFWSTSGLTDGSVHSIGAKAVDSSGNETLSSVITVTVDNSSGTSSGVLINEDLTARQVYPVNNWWNLDVSNAPLDANSSGFISFIGSSRTLHADFGGSPYGMPYITVPGDQPLKQVYFYAYGGESDDGAPGRPSGYPIPDEAYLTAGYIEGGQAGGGSSGDRHMLLIDRDNWLLFELFGTHWDAGAQRWEAASGAVFNLATNDRRPEGWTSTDAAGLAVFPGLIRYDEVYGAGEIEHALRFTVRASNGYVWPASHAAGTTPGAPPMGMRMRLKASVDISGYAPPVQKILRAMKKYGLIVADNGSDMYIQGTMDDRWDIGLINGVFHSMTAGNFEVIERGWDPINN